MTNYTKPHNFFIPALTGIRALSVYFIFLKHLNPFSLEDQPTLYLIINQFYCFLNFFFVLSGFLIYYKYHNVLINNPKSLRNYFINRFSRVFPILIILISITFFLEYYHGRQSFSESINLYILNITLLKGFSSKFLLTGIGPSWTLSVEELFYILSPFIFFYARNLKPLFWFVCLTFFLGLIITFIFSINPFYGYFSSLKFTLYSTFFGRVFEFACGIYLGMIVQGKIKNSFFSKIEDKTLLIGLTIIMCSIYFLYIISLNSNVVHGVEVGLGIFVNNLILPIGITFLFYSLIYCRSFLQRILSHIAIVKLGNSTYSFYLLHTTFVLTYIIKFVSSNIFIIWIVMVLISYIFYKVVEQPLTILVRKKLSR